MDIWLIAYWPIKIGMSDLNYMMFGRSLRFNASIIYILTINVKSVVWNISAKIH